MASKDPTAADENILMKIALIRSILQGKLLASEAIDEKLVAKFEVPEIEKIIEESLDVIARVTEALNRIDSFTKKAEKAEIPQRVADLANYRQKS